MDLKSFDWRSLRKYADPRAAEDLNVFLENLPKNAGQTVLIAAGIAWASAAGLGLFTSIEAKSLIELRTELREAKALTPVVPKIKDDPVSKAEVEGFVAGARKVYKGLDMKVNGSTLLITSRQTSNFGEFREAIGHVQNGGNGWRVTLDKLCVGRECDKQYKLAVALKINKISVENTAQ